MAAMLKKTHGVVSQRPEDEVGRERPGRRSLPRVQAAVALLLFGRGTRRVLHLMLGRIARLLGRIALGIALGRRVALLGRVALRRRTTVARLGVAAVVSRTVC